MQFKKSLSVILAATCLMTSGVLFASEVPFDASGTTTINTVSMNLANKTASANAMNYTITNLVSSSDSPIQYASYLPEDSYITPESFGAKGDGVTDDSEAFKKMFAQIANNTNSTESREQKGVYNINAPVCLLNPGSTYIITQTLHIPCAYLKMYGNGAKIKSNNTNRIFAFDVFDNGRASGWQTEIDSVEFIDCHEPIWFEYQNFEAGKIIISKCRFHECTGYAITTNRRSCTVTIRDNTFTGCDRYWSSNCNDISIFENNWASYYQLTDSDKSPIKLTRTEAPNDEFSCHISDNMFVPTDSSVVDGSAWIDCNVPDMTIERNRFGGEPGSMPVINVASGMTVNNDKEAERTSCIRVLNNFSVNGNNRIINLIGVPTLMEITGNRGFYGNTTAVGWDASVPKPTQDELIKNAEYLKIIYYGNSGYHVDNSRFWDEIKSNIPENLVPFVNKIYNTSDGSGNLETQLNDVAIQLDNLTKLNDSLQERISELEERIAAQEAASRTENTISLNSLLRLDVNSDGILDAVDASIILLIYSYNSTYHSPIFTFDDLRTTAFSNFKK